jgi:hypothetical protein
MEDQKNWGAPDVCTDTWNKKSLEMLAKFDYRNSKNMPMALIKAVEAKTTPENTWTLWASIFVIINELASDWLPIQLSIKIADWFMLHWTLIWRHIKNQWYSTDNLISLFNWYQQFYYDKTTWVLVSSPWDEWQSAIVELNRIKLKIVWAM